MQSVALVTTLIQSNHVVDSFIRYHQAIGFDYLFLFFDDPQELRGLSLEKYPQVFAIPHDDALRAAWKTSRLYAERSELIEYVDSEVMARQLLNVQIALERCPGLGIEWLLHIDIDELFYSPTASVKEHFADLSAKGITNVSYCNYEAVATHFQVNDYFKEIQLFKRNPSRLTRFQLQYVRQQARFGEGKSYFLYYQNGKSAGRVSDQLRPKDVHAFYSPNPTFFSASASILHYPVCGFSHFCDKYKTLGNFGNYWFGTFPINIPFHLSSRDIVQHHSGEAMADYYKNRILYADPEEIRVLTELGILTLIDAPARILSAG